MSISEKEIKAHENRYKNILYDKILTMISKQTELITQISSLRQGVDTDIPNIGVTFNNKLNELSHIFEDAGISMFVETNEKYNFIDSNFVGDAIIEDMISQLLKATQILSKYDSIISESTKKRSAKIKALEEMGPIKKIFLRIRSFFNPTIISDLTSYSEKEVEEAKSMLAEYTEVDKNLWEYNLKDNIVQSLIQFIKNKQYHDFDIPGILEECVIPTLQKLGLEDAITQLQEELSDSQKQQTISSRDKYEGLSTIEQRSNEITTQDINKEER